MTSNEDSNVNAWGLSWACFWGNSWGSCGTGASAKRRENRAKKAGGYPNEMAILERSLRERFEKPQPATVEQEIPQQKPQEESVNGEELLAEAIEIQGRMVDLKEQLITGIIEHNEYQSRKQTEEKALEAILMALEIDRYVLFTII